MGSRNNFAQSAPGHPGVEPRWTSSAKCGVGTSAQPASSVWFTLNRGAVTEVYCPEIDYACLRELSFVVTDGTGFVSDERTDTSHTVEFLNENVPAFRLTNECERYRIEKEIVTDPRLDVLLQQIRFVSSKNENRLHLYVLLAPRLGDCGAHNSAWIEQVWAEKILFASHDNHALALSCSLPFLKSSVGFAGVSDGWEDLRKHKCLTWEYARAEDGNVGLVAEIDLAKSGGEFMLAVGFASDPLGAAHHARAGLLDGFPAARKEYISGWQRWQNKSEARKDLGANRLFGISAAVLETHTAKRFPGAIVASLSVPWGFARGDEDRGGYHVAWVRDLVEVAGGFSAAGFNDEAARVLRYLAVTQKADGSWPQNMWANGKPYWGGDQMDETAFPVVLAARAWRDKSIDQQELNRLWPMLERALRYIVCNGPATKQDRWEEIGGYSPFTLAIEIAALIDGAELFRDRDEQIATYLRETADSWNDSIERWVYATETNLAREHGVDGYYVRIAPQRDDSGSPVNGLISIKNHSPEKCERAANIVSPDALALVNYGLRAADDPRILNTVRVIDALLKIDTENGPCWHRYNHDGYGEHVDGSPFDGTGVGRAWPLLTGERAHYELAAGRKEEALRLLHAMEAFAGDGGMIPEQIWDSPDISERGLFFGRPSGSAMPLVWAHAEYIKLCRSLRDGHVYSMPELTRRRYAVQKTKPAFSTWRFTDKIQSLLSGKVLRIEVLSPADVHWSIDRWRTCCDSKTIDSKLGVHFVDLSPRDLADASRLDFTFHWSEAGKWEGRDFSIAIVSEGNR